MKDHLDIQIKIEELNKELNSVVLRRDQYSKDNNEFGCDMMTTNCYELLAQIKILQWVLEAKEEG